MPPRTPLILATALLALAGCQGVSLEPTDQPTTGSTRSTQDVNASQKQLDTLTVAKAGSMAKYSRDRFPHWRSTGDNCDVRDTVLKRDGKKVKYSGCNVVAGTWNSLYDGQVLNSPTKVDIDHMVPLANAWRSGAAKWTDDKRGDFANDLDDPQLIAVSASSNRSKGDQDPSTWKPTETSAWCEYAQDWVAVKAKWKLTVTTKEKAALEDMLGNC
ncbi:HNH endonuclease family protein [Paractinoplanes hotanensis]|uniref:HNH endonuclease family protein n=1 Tax=Paractinoplanes hotanensis TaxID=2906497 RepID=A0ABT0XUY1_9ACTN|nr:HNH endonuclease family protein [Actinoplanes hotanensis]MCM4077445.1 HNH endonuclease family protein [Actinoplanes hotanensis]